MQNVFAVQIGNISPTFNAFSSFGHFVSTIVRNGIVLAALIAFLFIIFGGFAYIIGAGGSDSKRIEQGKQTITMAVIGLIVVVFAFWIVQIIEILTGVQLLSPTL